jgi:drug/metabolite transporter (DMT)-like permease
MDALTLRAMLSLAYLILFGSIVAFGSYVWLLRVSPPSRISTYAYVNPLVAVFLGWSMAGEAVTSRTIVAAALILIGVALVNTRGAADAAAEKESVAHKKNLTMRPDPLKKGLPENSEECT